MEDIRKSWFTQLSKASALAANDALNEIFECLAIEGGLTASELELKFEAEKSFKEITGMEADTVIDAFVEYGYCYGNDYIPESYFQEGA
jgi:hypothetical protein